MTHSLFLRLAILKEEAFNILLTDILMTKMFFLDFCKNKPHRFAEISSEAGSILQKYSWPGNIRELKGVMERVSILYEDTVLRAEHLSFLHSGTPNGEKECADSMQRFYLPDSNFSLEKTICELVESALIKNNGNKKRPQITLGFPECLSTTI